MKVRKNNSKPFNLNVPIAPEEEMNNGTERLSTGVFPEDKRDRPNVACEKLPLAEATPSVFHTRTLDHLSNRKGKRLKHHNEEASSTDIKNVPPNPRERATEADPQTMHFICQQSSCLTPMTSKFARPTQQQQEQEQEQLRQQEQRTNTDTRPSSPGMGPSGLPIEIPANLQSAGSPHLGSYAQILQREMRRVSADREKMRHEMERFLYSVGVLQSQIEERRREIEALQSENEGLQRENEALRQDSS